MPTSRRRRPPGFNPARNKAAQAEFEKLTGFAYIPDSHRDRRREVGELGLLAIIYYNHGVELTRAEALPGGAAGLLPGA